MAVVGVVVSTEKENGGGEKRFGGDGGGGGVAMVEKGCRDGWRGHWSDKTCQEGCHGGPPRAPPLLLFVFFSGLSLSV